MPITAFSSTKYKGELFSEAKLTGTLSTGQTLKFCDVFGDKYGKFNFDNTQ